ncbi:MAG: hypothetical protein AAF846_21885 [Chloroflexota bacterium]
MPIEIEYIDDNIIIMRMIGFLTNDEITTTIEKEVRQRVAGKPDFTLHAIYDVTEFEWSFAEFINYIKQRAPERSRENEGTVHEHFVGNSQWVQQLRTWWQKQLGKETTAFISMDDAIAYARSITPTSS